jgi:hypothetical protein
MRINNKLDHLFGSSGTFAGYTILAVGVLTLVSSIGFEGSIILIVIGAFVALTQTGTLIDTKTKKVQMYTRLFGLFRMGSWYPLDTFSSLTITKSVKRQRTYSRSNRQLITSQKDYRVTLIGKDPTFKLPVKKTKTLDDAKAELETLSQKLEIKADDLNA